MRDNLDSLTRSYKRLSLDVRGRMEFALDSNSNIALAIAEQEQEHLDQGFFVLAFAALEREVNLLFLARRPDAKAFGTARKLEFQKRVATACEIAQNVLGQAPVWATTAKEIESWHVIRSDVAHGESPAESFDVFKVVERANEVATTRERVAQALAKQTP